MLILGSKSKARFELLKLYNAEVEVLVSDAQEVFNPELSLKENVVNVAYDKAKAILDKHDLSQDILVCADTIVVANNECLQKPLDYDDAFRMIQALSNNTIEVISGVFIKNKIEEYKFSDSSYITFGSIDRKTIIKYLNENPHYLDISGALDIDRIKPYINYTIKGSYSNIVGLPLHKITEKLYDKDAYTNESISNEKIENIEVYRSSTRGIIEENGKIVLLKGYTFDKKHIFYHTIGGGYHHLENSSEVLKKEAIEEGGLILDNLKPLLVVREYNTAARNNNYNKMTLHSYYSATIKDYCDVNYIEYEVDLLLGIDYFSIDEAIDIVEKQLDFFSNTDYPVNGMSFSDLQALKKYKEVQSCL